MTDLRSRLIKNSTIDFTATLTDSKIFGKKDMIPTRVPMINVALSGSIDGGLTPGLTVLAAPSKHFKTAFSLLLASAFLRANPDGIVLFYDSEFGTPESYFTSFGVPLDSVVHTPITDIEQLKFDIMHQLSEIKRNDKIMIVVDSVGNLASKKEVEDAMKQSSAADMTRAKQLKSLFRMVTPHLTLKDIPMVVVNHVYMTQEMYSKAVVSGGTGIYYSADNIWIIGRQQDKDDKELLGYHFVINIEKSRYLKEKSKIPITVSFDSGINKWSGLLDLALEGKFITKPKLGWYARVDQETGEIMGKNYRAGDIVDNNDFWKSVFEETNFAEWIKNKYILPVGEIMADDTEENNE
jgi:RecA/RadA recombinase